MDKAQTFVDDFLSHYTSEFYDPVKAHEYYLKTRELKGRQSTGELRTAKKKEAWTYAKTKIAETKKEELASASERQKIFVEKVRASATEHRKQISEKLTAVLTLLTENKKVVSDQISEEAKAQIDALPEIPKGISKELRAKLSQKRAEEIAKIRGDANQQRTDLSVGTQDVKTQQRELSARDREVISVDLKAVIDKARTDYKAQREMLKLKYEQKAQSEYDAIKTQV